MQKFKKDYLTIGEIVKKFKKYYPDVTCSKLRFLESKGLIKPNRADNKYRVYNGSDFLRINEILKMQKESFLPLKIIKERLENINLENKEKQQEIQEQKEQLALQGLLQKKGQAQAKAQGQTQRRAQIQGQVPGQLLEKQELQQELQRELEQKEFKEIQGQQKLQNNIDSNIDSNKMSLEEICLKFKISKDFVKSLCEEGFVSFHEEDGTLYFNGFDIEIIKISSKFSSFGLLPKHLKLFENSAIRQSNLLQQIVYPLILSKRKNSYKKAVKLISKLESIFIEFHEMLFKKENKKFLENYK